MKKKVALLLASICVLSAVIYSFIQYAILEPARRMEEDLVQVASSMYAQGDIAQAIKTLEALRERRYCYNKCLNLLGQLENRRSNFPAALIYCRESLNSDRSKCTNGDSLRCMVTAYTGLKQSEKAFLFQEHLLNCNQLPVEDSLVLLKYFLADNATAKALNLLTLHHMFESAPIDVKTEANAIMKSYGYRSLLKNRTNDQINVAINNTDPMSLNITMNSENLTTTVLENMLHVVCLDNHSISQHSGMIDNQTDKIPTITFPEAESEPEYIENITKIIVNETEDNVLDENNSRTDYLQGDSLQYEFQSEIVRNETIPNLELEIQDKATASAGILDTNANFIEETEEIKFELKVNIEVESDRVKENSNHGSVNVMADNISVISDSAKTIEFPVVESNVDNNGDAKGSHTIIQGVNKSLGELSSQKEPSNSSIVHNDAVNSEATNTKSAKSNDRNTENKPVLTSQQERQAKQQEQQRRAARSYVNIASTYLQRGDTAMAMKQINLALKKAPTLSDALFVRSQIYLQQQEYLKAIPDLITIFQDSSGANDTAADFLCQLAEYSQQQQQFSSVVSIYQVMSSFITPEISSHNDPSSRNACMGDLQWLHYADAHAAMQDYSTAISILDRFMNESQQKLEGLNNEGHHKSKTITTMVERRYVQWLEYTGNHNRTDSFFQQAWEKGDISLWEYTGMLLRKNQTDKVLSIYEKEEKKWQQEIANLEQNISLLQQKLTPSINAAKVNDNNEKLIITEEENPHLQKTLLQERQNLRQAKLSLGEVLKHFGSLCKFHFHDSDKANDYMKQAMALGVYDRDIRRFVASSPTMMIENSLNKEINLRGSFPNLLENISTNHNHIDSDSNDISQLSDETVTKDSIVLKEEKVTDKVFPHRRHQLPLFFPNHRWIVHRLADQPYFSMQQLRAQSSRQQDPSSKENRMMMGGNTDLQLLFDQFENNQHHEYQHYAEQSREVDDVIRVDDSPFERERKRKLQEQKAQAKQEEEEKYQRRQEAMLDGYSV